MFGQRVWSEMSELNWFNQFFRFVVIGGVNTVVGYLIFAFFVFVGFHYSIASLFATILGVMFNFKTTGKFVFGNHNNRLIFRFIGVYLIAYLLQVVALNVLLKHNVDLFLAGALVIGPVAIVTFILNKKFVFGVGKEQ